jgi:hypothetical protein
LHRERNPSLEEPAFFRIEANVERRDLIAEPAVGTVGEIL